MRNRKYKQKLGPIVVYGQDADCVRAFRNIPGVDVLNVERLNLLKIAPGGLFISFFISLHNCIVALFYLII